MRQRIHLIAPQQIPHGAAQRRPVQGNWPGSSGFSPRTWIYKWRSLHMSHMETIVGGFFPTIPRKYFSLFWFSPFAAARGSATPVAYTRSGQNGPISPTGGSEQQNRRKRLGRPAPFKRIYIFKSVWSLIIWTLNGTIQIIWIFCNRRYYTSNQYFKSSFIIFNYIK